MPPSLLLPLHLRCLLPAACVPPCVSPAPPVAVWDLLFFEHHPVVLFRVALALVEIYDQVLLACLPACCLFTAWCWLLLWCCLPLLTGAGVLPAVAPLS